MTSPAFRPTEGTTVTVTTTVTDDDGAPTDATTIVCTTRAPDGTQATVALDAHPAVGVYVHRFPVTAGGRWVVHVAAVDPTVVEEATFVAVGAYVTP